jgi:hypothetical protein
MLMRLEFTDCILQDTVPSCHKQEDNTAENTARCRSSVRIEVDAFSQFLSLLRFTLLNMPGAGVELHGLLRQGGPRGDGVQSHAHR